MDVGHAVDEMPSDVLDSRAVMNMHLQNQRATELIKRQKSQITRHNGSNYLMSTNQENISIEQPNNPAPDQSLSDTVDQLLQQFYQDQNLSMSMKMVESVRGNEMGRGQAYSNECGKRAKRVAIADPHLDGNDAWPSIMNIPMRKQAVEGIGNLEPKDPILDASKRGHMRRDCEASPEYYAAEPMVPEAPTSAGSMANGRLAPSGRINANKVISISGNSKTLLPPQPLDVPMSDVDKHMPNHEWVESKIQQARFELDHMENESSLINSHIYAVFNDLLGISEDFGINFSTPEVVVVGMQSDGKSSLIEGLLGFQFNLVNTNIGTRRPIIIQMINDASCKEPKCRFRREEAAAVNDTEDLFEDSDTPVHCLSEEITLRTNNRTGSSADRVSSSPIILRVRYQRCANLTIFDTPGFRLGGNESLRREIEDMVLKLASPEHRIILCLDQSTVEAVNTASRPLVSRIDPKFRRTIIVNTKFDNRVKELRDAESVKNYMRGEGILSTKLPFFISMPVQRGLDPITFRKEIEACYLNDLRSLWSVGFENPSIEKRMGIFNLRSTLERWVQTQYLSCITPTVEKLDHVIESLRSEILSLQNRMKNNGIEQQKRRFWRLIQHFCNLIDKFLHGSVLGNPDFYGDTLTQEREACKGCTWPLEVQRALTDKTNGTDTIEYDVQLSNGLADASSKCALVLANGISYNIPNADLALYGGSQFNRLMTEFEYVAHSVEMPKISVAEVASSLGMSKSHNMPNVFDAASDIARTKSKMALLPLFHVVLKRAHYILWRMFEIAIKVISDEETDSQASCKEESSLGPFRMGSTLSRMSGDNNGLPWNEASQLSHHSDVQNNEHNGPILALAEELGRVYAAFLSSILSKCDKSMRSDMDKLTTIMDCDMINGVQEIIKTENHVSPSPSQTRNRVMHIMSQKTARVQDMQSMLDDPSGHCAAAGEVEAHPRKGSLEDSRHLLTLRVGSHLFAGIRFFFVKYARANVSTYLLDPMFTQIFPTLMDHFSSMSQEKIEMLFMPGARELAERHAMLMRQLERVEKSRKRLNELIMKLKLMRE